MEYQCFDLSPRYKLAHEDDAPVLLETDCLSEASGFIYDRFKELGIECAIWQPRLEIYRGHYKHPVKHSKRGKDGKFVTN